PSELQPTKTPCQFHGMCDILPTLSSRLDPSERVVRTIAVTLGDAAGVGPEILLRAHATLCSNALPIVYGDASILHWAQEDLLARGILSQRQKIVRISSPENSTPEAICVLDCASETMPTASGPYP